MWSCLYVFAVEFQTDPNCNDTDKDYKKVAKVEEFFDIIYDVHVDMDGRGGKHAGQKRTYRAVSKSTQIDWLIDWLIEYLMDWLIDSMLCVVLFYVISFKMLTIFR